MKRLVVFDVDGTLTLTMDLDAEIYVEAVRQVLEIDEVNTDWSCSWDVQSACQRTSVARPVRRSGRLIR